MHDMNNEDVEKTLDDINKMAKIEKIHEEIHISTSWQMKSR